MMEGTEKLFSGKFLEIYEDTYDNGKKIVKWERCSRKNNVKAVMIVPYHDYKHSFVMISEYRIPIRNYEIGFPAGLMDNPNESVEDVVRRELKEETGLNLLRIIKTSPFTYTSSGMTDESILIAYVLVSGEVSKDYVQPSEDITPMFVTRTDIKNMLKHDYIKWGSKAWIICDNIVNPIDWDHA